MPRGVSLKTIARSGWFPTALYLLGCSAALAVEGPGSVAPLAGPKGPGLAAPSLSHHARVELDPATHRLTVSDTLAFGQPGPRSFALNVSLALATGAEMARANNLFVAHADSLVETQAACRTYLPTRGPTEPESQGQAFVLEYSGTFFESTAGIVFSRENVGREIQATISDEGVYLAASACWLPTVEGALATHRLTVITPAGIESVTEGTRVLRVERGGKLITVWNSPHPSDGLTLVAGKYIVTEKTHPGRAGPITISTWFLQDDPRLVTMYLERTGAYLAMYEEMIGPYPYGKFATVENWFPTGYGFPSYTLLGGMVLRLPFIPYTSFGHEICHNWWGNSVYVAEEGGNWCEGLTSYCADYHYKELESPAAAREYRRNLLKDYAAYVRAGRDMPLVEFMERHTGATRAIGYGKSMMVFHMIDRAIGREAFLAALRDIYARLRFQRASWDDFLNAFAAASGQDLATFGEQWLQRVGAPALILRSAERKGDKVVVELEQASGHSGGYAFEQASASGTPWQLDVPLSITTERGRHEQIVRLEQARGRFEIAAPGAREVALDPDYHLFRRLHPLEIEPTISMVLGEEVPMFVLPPGDEAMVAAGEAFARAWSESDAPALAREGRPPADLPAGSQSSLVLCNPTPEELARRMPAGLAMSGDLVFLDGKRYSLKEYDLVFAAANPGRQDVADLVVICREAARLAGLADRIGHYGKYSYLLFPAGKGEVVKGNWPPGQSPLVARLP